MRIAHLTDTHVTDGHRLEDHRETLHRVVSEILATRPALVLITGDLAGRTVPHRTTPRERGVLYPELVRLAGAAPVVVLYGNHDQDPDMDALVHLDGEWPIRVLKAAGEQLINTPAGPCFLYWLAYPTKRWLLAGEESTGLAATQRAVEHKLATLCELWAMQIGARRRTHPGAPQIFAGHLQIGGAKTSGGEVLAGQEIELQRPHLEQLGVDYGALGHLHLRQEVAPRCWYAGSPWRNDFGETETWKGWNLIDVGDPDEWPGQPLVGDDPAAIAGQAYDPTAIGQLDTRVLSMSSRCRRFTTLDYRWAQAEGAERPGWTTRPKALANGQPATPVNGDEVRMRLVVPQQHLASCPWEQEIALVRAAGAHRVQVERTIEPSLRVRSPEVAAAETLEDKTVAYWGTLGTAPGSESQLTALALLDELVTQEDEQIAETRDALIAAGATT